MSNTHNSSLAVASAFLIFKNGNEANIIPSLRRDTPIGDILGHVEYFETYEVGCVDRIEIRLK